MHTRSISLKKKRNTIVLGQQLADAQDAEAARLATGVDGQSPMPGGEYNGEGGEYSLITITPLPIDMGLRSLTEQFMVLDGERREDVRRRISLDEQYTLIHFAKRSAVMALNEKSRKRCEEGITALAIIDETRIDHRDAAWAAGLLSYVASVLNEDTKQLFRHAGSLSTPGMSRILSRQRKPTKLSEWGYAEVRTGNSVGLIESDGSRYEPSLKLTEIALKTARWLGEGRYVAEPVIAAEVPSIWFPEEDRGVAEVTLNDARGAIRIRANLRAKYSAKASDQMFAMWIAEMSSECASGRLLECVGDGMTLAERFAVGFSVGRLFGLCVAGSSVVGAKSFESLESLAALVKPIEAQLAQERMGHRRGIV